MPIRNRRRVELIEHCLIATAFGPVGIAWSAAGLVRLQLPYADAEETRARLLRGLDDAQEAHPPAWLEASVKLLQQYFAGRPVDLRLVPVDFERVPDFEKAVYVEAMKLGWGETSTYGELAARAGSPGAAQAVGRAMGRNPVAVVMPCHRVLASGGKPGGFSAPGGKSTKLRLLAMEGVRVGPPEPAQRSFVF